MIWRLLLALTVIGMLSGGADATVFFDENFETAVVPFTPPSGWTLRTNNFPDGVDHCVISTEQAHSGTKSVKFTYSNTDASQDNFDACDMSKGNQQSAGDLTALPHVTEMYFRAWRYTINYFPSPVNGHSKMMYIKNFSPSTGTGAFPEFIPENLGNRLAHTGTVDSYACYSSNIVGGVQVGGAYTTNWFNDCEPFAGDGGLAVPIPDNSWHCLEYHYKLNTPGVRDGVIQSWIDGALQINLQNLETRAPTTTGSNFADATFGGFMLYRQSAAQGSIIYWDDPAAGDTRIGCAGTAATPGTPANLTISWLTTTILRWFGVGSVPRWFAAAV
jgi:hypothetical protein